MLWTDLFSSLLAARIEAVMHQMHSEKNNHQNQMNTTDHDFPFSFPSNVNGKNQFESDLSLRQQLGHVGGSARDDPELARRSLRGFRASDRGRNPGTGDRSALLAGDATSCQIEPSEM